MIKLHKSEGFSLIELMIVVAIMAILAALAIPTFLNFQMKAKESEARTNLAAIKTCEESYKVENDIYLACTLSPAAVPPAATLIAWVDNGGFTDIGFNPNGSVRYVYDVTPGVPAVTYTATATGDVDGDGNLSDFSVSDTTNVVKNNDEF